MPGLQNEAGKVFLSFQSIILNDVSIKQEDYRMNGNKLSWLYREIPKWVEKNIVTDKDAKNIRAYYGPADLSRQSSTTQLLLICLGALLVGLGILLLLSNNWYRISSDWRLGIGVVLLLLSQLVNLTVLLQKAEGTAFAEGSGILHGLVLFAVVGLMGGTFHLDDNFTGYLFVCLIFLLPAIYLLRSVGACIIYLFATLYWSVNGSSIHTFGGENFAWIFLAAIMPYYQSILREKQQDARLIWLSWSLAIAVYGVFFFTRATHVPVVHLLLYTCVAAVTYFVGTFLPQMGRWALPFKWLGLLGLLITLLFGSSETTWVVISHMDSLYWGDIVLSIGLLTMVGFLCILAMNQRLWRVALPGLIPFAVAIGVVLASYQIGFFVITLLFNIVVFLISLYVMNLGIRQLNMKLINVGIIIFFALVACRFFDNVFSNTARGIVFVVIGAVMLLINVCLKKWLQPRLTTAHRRSSEKTGGEAGPAQSAKANDQVRGSHSTLVKQKKRTPAEQNKPINMQKEENFEWRERTGAVKAGAVEMATISKFSFELKPPEIGDKGTITQKNAVAEKVSETEKIKTTGSPWGTLSPKPKKRANQSRSPWSTEGSDGDEK